ncbi:class I SAM-dependent methyltransferase [Candidatus Laterigemmans baculatus]|uniref:class I SAM-dependent methyltransferase n=1 Tax=Candidatus Laterigemmans baculatus TaxID=2770505 RepID=UPI0013DCE40C|nr:class I SAM-dependent methyltransferase [Candidatus Laterigemmans baculatus]
MADEQLPNDRLPDDRLPDYAHCLQLQHAAFATDLREMLEDLLRACPEPASGGREIADIACGDGFFSRLLAEIDPRNRVVGLDVDEAYLAVARRDSPARLSARLSFQNCDLLEPEQAERFAEAFDVVFCIDSLESIEDHAGLLRQMVRLCRPGGVVIVTETDNLHDLIGSWPPETENLLHRLEWEGLADQEKEGYAFPRYASALLRSAGLADLTVRSYTFDRSGPFDEPLKAWLGEQFRERLDNLSRGTAAERAELRRHLHPAGEDYFANSPHALLTYLRFCILGRKPDVAAESHEVAW